MSSNNSVFRAINKYALGIYIFLALFGLLNIYSVTYKQDSGAFLGISDFAIKQLIWVSISFVCALAIMLTDWRLIQRSSYFLYGAMILLLLVTLVIAPNIKGSRSWLQFGPFSLQPAEFSKFVTALALAKFMSRPNFKLAGWNYVYILAFIFLPAGIIVLQHETGSALVFAMFVVMLYREGMPGLVLALGGAMVSIFIMVVCFDAVPFLGYEACSTGIVIGTMIVLIIALGFLVAYRPSRARTTENAFEHKMPWYAILISAVVLLIALMIDLWLVKFNYFYVIAGVCAALTIFLIVLSFVRWRIRYALIAAFIIVGVGTCFAVNYFFDNMLEDYQRNRILVTFNMVQDPRGIGYNINQSRIALGNGGFFGRGFLNGTQTHLSYVPEQHTDFIFSAIGEEWGFLGCLVILVAYGALLFSIIGMAEKAKSKYVRAYGYFVAGIFIFHLLINVGMVLGIMPVIGIPLPFISYGGSSFLAFTILLFILLRLDASRLAD